MIVSSFITLAISTGADDVTVQNVTFLARKAKAGDTDERKDRPLSTRSGMEEALAFDGKLDTSAQTYGFSSYFKHYYLDTDGTFKYDLEDNTAKGVYYGLFVIELTAASTLDNMTIWGSNDKGSATFANDGYDIFYSADGVTYTAVNGASFSGMTGDGATAGANSGAFSATKTEGTDTYYGHQIDMGDVNAKFVAIAVTSPTKNSNKDAVLREVTFNDEVQQITPPAEPAETVTMVEISNMGRRTKAGKNFDTELITYTNSDVLTMAIDGDLTTSSCSNGLGSDFTHSVTYDNSSKTFVNQKQSYHDVIILKLAAETTLTDVTVWGGSNKTSTSFMNDAFDVYYSANGETYTYIGGVHDMKGDGLSVTGANANLASAEKVVGSTTYYGVTFKASSVKATYVAIAVARPTGMDNRIMIDEITFNNGADVAVESASNMGRRTKSGKNFETEFITYTNNDVLAKAFDGDHSTGCCSNNLGSDYAPSIVFDSKTSKFEAVQDLKGGASYHDVIIIKFSDLAKLNNMTVWGGTDKTGSSFMNNAFSVYYSADGVTYTYVGSANNMCGDGISTAGIGASRAYYTATVGTDTYYGINFDMGGVTAGYVAIAVSEIAKYDRVTFREFTFNDAKQDPPAGENPDDSETPAEPTQMGIGIQSVIMPWTSFDALVGETADKQACATKMFDGNLDTTVVWRNSNKYKPTESQLASGKVPLAYNGSMVDGKIVEFDGTADANDFYDAIIMDLSNDTENKTYNVGTLRWYIGNEVANISSAYSVYYSTDGETWTLANQYTDMYINYGKECKADKETGILYHDIPIDAEGVRYVMLTVENGRNDKDFLMWNVKELVVYEKGTEPVEPPKENKPSTSTPSNPKPSTPTTAETDAPADTAAPADTVAEEKSGCGSSIGMGVVATVIATGAAVGVIRKKKED